jgi:ATP-dependent DNA helicase RecG
MLVLPVYKTKSTGLQRPKLLHSKDFQGLMKHALEKSEELVDLVPEALQKRLELVSLQEALRGIHTPADVSDIRRGRERLAFEELFIVQLGLLLERHRQLSASNSDGSKRDMCCITSTRLVAKVKPTLFEKNGGLTPSQEKVLEEILADMASPQPMLRLVQGDVGCGKTVVAFLALLAAVDSEWQAALIAPTEVLARQHYDTFRKWIDNAFDNARDKPQVVLLTGSTNAKEKDLIKQQLASGQAHIAVGTHALLANRVDFSRLGLVVIDEQHRFGVEQRSEVSSQFTSLNTSAAPHMLSMTATPIPRTLAMVEEGIFALSAIEKGPEGRLPVETKVLAGDEGREAAYSALETALDRSSEAQAYVVCSLVEESTSSKTDGLTAVKKHMHFLQERLPHHRCTVLHGRMTGEEKAEALHSFRTGETRVLVATRSRGRGLGSSVNCFRGGWARQITLWILGGGSRTRGGV